MTGECQFLHFIFAFSKFQDFSGFRENLGYQTRSQIDILNYLMYFKISQNSNNYYGSSPTHVFFILGLTVLLLFISPDEINPIRMGSMLSSLHMSQSYL